ncbi:MAG: sulfurtransferase TusA family protein [Candidatus Poseidoniales archaeon]|jgi:TusA-related sulfurtransferase|tara:strand:- start:275 stop:589 length:315 start_codon:yes stop_codon:yes gene_type:complete
MVAGLKRDIHEVVAMLEPLPLGKGAVDEVSKRIDVIGFLCPIPISMTREALAEMETGEVLEVWADDPETLHDMPILLQRVRATLLSVETDAGEYRYLIKTGGTT